MSVDVTELVIIESLPAHAARVKRILRRTPGEQVALAGSRNKARIAIAEQIRGMATNRREYYRRFIMADLYPENETRFPPWDAVSLLS